MNLRWILILGIILLLAAGLRILGCMGDLWIDEAYMAWVLRHQTPHWTEIFTAMPESNNHHLYSLVMYWLCGISGDFMLRLPAAIAGVISVALFGWIAAMFHTHNERRKHVAAAAMCMLSISYLFVLYGSEARGYSFSILFTLLTVASVQAGQMKPWSAWGPVFWIGMILGPMSQLNAVYVLSGVGFWAAVVLLSGTRGWNGRIASALWNFAIPFVVLAVFYFCVARQIIVAGTPDRNPIEAISGLINCVLGLPITLNVALGLTLVVGLTAAAAGAARKSLGNRWALYLGGILIGPLVFYAIKPPQVLFERYFLGSALIWYLLIIEGAVRMWVMGR